MSEKNRQDKQTDSKKEQINAAEILSSSEINKEAPSALPPHKEYAKRILQFESYYKQLIITLGVVIGVSIVIAVIYNVIIGLSAAIVASVIYAVFASDEMLKRLGLNYKSTAGGIRITSCRARYGDVIWIPARLIGFDVIKIDDKAFASDKNEALSCVFLPSTLKEMGENIFEGCDALRDIHFEGTEDQWNKIEKKTDLSSITIHFGAKYPPIPKKKVPQKAKKKAPKKSGK